MAALILSFLPAWTKFSDTFSWDIFIKFGVENAEDMEDVENVEVVENVEKVEVVEGVDGGCACHVLKSCLSLKTKVEPVYNISEA